MSKATALSAEEQVIVQESLELAVKMLKDIQKTAGKQIPPCAFKMKHKPPELKALMKIYQMIEDADIRTMLPALDV